MLTAVIPAKSLALAKRRLAPALPDAARADLVRRMLMQVLDALSAAGVQHRVVATGDPALAALAASRGAGSFDPGTDGDLNAAAAAATAHVRSRGATSLLLLAGDLPWLETADVLALLDAGADASVVIGEAKDGGTNALLLTPPDAIPFAFATAERSAERHRALAAERNLAAAVIRRPGLARDVDLPADLVILLADHPAYRDLALAA